MNRYAIFFPQFHRISINDKTWGAGFTDWHLIAYANAFNLWDRRAPLSGFYDLSKHEDIKNQFELAATYGIDGFGIYHYWFDNGPELNSVENYLSDVNNPIFKLNYFFIWANENWTKRWAGSDTSIIKTINTSPSVDDIKKHVNYISKFMFKREYTKVDGRPMFVIYRPDFFYDTKYVIEIYRQEFRLNGINPLIGYFIKNKQDERFDKIFDFAYLFEPRLFFNFYSKINSSIFYKFYSKVLLTKSYRYLEQISKYINIFIKKKHRVAFNIYLNYMKSPDRIAFSKTISCKTQNVISSGWNNTPRYRNNYFKIEAPTAAEFEELVKYTSLVKNEYPLLCNAWNEWSEGAAIEPCYYFNDYLTKIYMKNYF